ncbi:type I methionyl aminopeptidase [Secundilactobacillus kimchicus]|uniref:type I methionyl aminopeptidase n=1 Tax=Secundilactobacillus kimchicus TaxID=528209 RepID=UPI0024A8D85B|nr:type I methionyl aminopeptidase [Secundilactobacillus kimchicus]
MITLKSEREIEGMAHSGAILADMLKGLTDVIKPGISSWEIETYAINYFDAHDAVAEEKNVDGYNYATCVSVNDEVAHAAPRKALILHEGDIVAVDTVVNWHGYMSDACWTYPVGTISDERKRLMEMTQKSLYLGIDQAVVGNRLGDIGYAIQHYTEDENGLGDVRELIGHGIQPSMHEAPDVPAYGRAGHGLRLKAGMTITIEPMITTGGWEIRAVDMPGEDWEYYVTADGSDCAQFEHTIVITEDGPKILTSVDSEMDAKYLLS